MVAKVGIVEKLGERAVLLPALIEEGLAANDQLKIRLTMFQEAAAEVSQPGRAAPSMERERRGVGLTDPIFNATISGARRIDDETFLAPGAEALAAGMARDLTAMMAPTETESTRFCVRCSAANRNSPSATREKKVLNVEWNDEDAIQDNHVSTGQLGARPRKRFRLRKTRRAPHRQIAIYSAIAL